MRCEVSSAPIPPRLSASTSAASAGDRLRASGTYRVCGLDSSGSSVATVVFSFVASAVAVPIRSVTSVGSAKIVRAATEYASGWPSRSTIEPRVAGIVVG